MNHISDYTREISGSYKRNFRNISNVLTFSLGVPVSPTVLNLDACSHIRLLLRVPFYCILLRRVQVQLDSLNLHIALCKPSCTQAIPHYGALLYRSTHPLRDSDLLHWRNRNLTTPYKPWQDWSDLCLTPFYFTVGIPRSPKPLPP